MKRLMLLCICALVLILSATGISRAEAFDDLPTYFLLYDYSGNVQRRDYNSWRAMVRQAYHFPYYKLIEGDTAAREKAKAILYHYGDKPDEEAMAEVAKELGATAVVVLQVHDMFQRTAVSMNPWNHEVYVRTVASADVYCYNSRAGYGQPESEKNSSDKKKTVSAEIVEEAETDNAAATKERFQGEPRYKHKRIREAYLRELGNAKDPSDIIKWKLANCINEMEGRELY